MCIRDRVRDMFGIEPGDMLLLLADEAQGIGILPFNSTVQLFDDVFSKKEPEEE